jgi:uncharacterized protein (DUF2267 family)
VVLPRAQAGGVTHQSDPFALAKITAGRWLDRVAAGLDTHDRQYAHRVLHAWLHLVRDQLTMDAVSHLGAQLPELLRGIYYEGWRPRNTQVHHGLGEFVQHFAREAGISPGDVPVAATRVSSALDRLFSPGQLDHALNQMPRTLREYLSPLVRQD